MLRKLREFFSRKKKKQEVPINLMKPTPERCPTCPSYKTKYCPYPNGTVPKYLLNVPVTVKKAGSQATRQDVGKFMKHSTRQLKTYRKSIKSKKDPNEES